MSSIYVCMPLAASAVDLVHCSNTIDVLSDPFFGPDQFVDLAGGDLTVRDDSVIYCK